MKQNSDQLQSKTFLLILLLTLAGFLLVVAFRGSFASIDGRVNAWAVSIQIDSLTALMIIVSDFFAPSILFIISLLIAAFLFVKNHIQYSILLLSTMASQFLIVFIVRSLIASPRPINEVILQTGYSFPSGHVTGNIVFFGVLTYVAWQIWPSLKEKAAIFGLCIIVVCIVGFDRVYLNVHWFSDVIGAALLGTFWLVFVLIVFRCIQRIHYVRIVATRLRLTQKADKSRWL